MPFYRKKPVVIEAVQFMGGPDSAQWCIQFAGLPETAHTMNVDGHPDQATGYVETLTIRTLEGDMRADVGDYIIRGVKGEFYPCKPDIFEATYDPAPWTAYSEVAYQAPDDVDQQAQRDVEAATANLDDQIALSFDEQSAATDGGVSAEVVRTLKGA
jgi:hypothetical protein